MFIAHCLLCSFVVGVGAWKRRRYSAGPTSSARRNARRIVSGGAEATGRGDRRNRLCGVLQTPARRLQAHLLDVARGRDAGLGAERAGEVARAHVRARGERLDGQVGRGVLDHEALDLAQRLARGLLRGRASR